MMYMYIKKIGKFNILIKITLRGRPFDSGGGGAGTFWK